MTSINFIEQVAEVMKGQVVVDDEAGEDSPHLLESNLFLHLNRTTYRLDKPASVLLQPRPRS